MIKHNKKFMASRAIAKCFVSMMGQNITKLKCYDFSSKKFNTKLPYDVAIPEELKTELQRDSCIPVFIAALFTMATRWKQPRSPLMNEWINKIGIYLQWDIIQH